MNLLLIVQDGSTKALRPIERSIADWVKRRFPAVAVLFTSGYTDNAIIHQGRLDKGVELLNKPYRRVALAHKIRSVLDKPST